ncbi:histidine kinase [uncultured Polaribacter sp.]|uniref:sensor histidine kinase n=1 Tax=uncultured Polaribacter sp. TaxID=174711 RepID=UPI0026196D11|nr:histidine kinase [uncultured Polaribacter sp.]
MKLIFQNLFLFFLKLSLIWNGFLLTILLFLSLNSKAQENNFKKINDSEKFVVHKIAQDSFNNIWLGTNNGFIKFDGVSLKSYDFKIGNSSRAIQSLFSKNDSIFIGKNKNLYLKTKNNIFTFDAKSVNTICNRKNEYYFGTNQGILHFRKDYLQPLKTTYNLDFSVINTIVFYKNHFLVSSNSGLWQLDELIQPKKVTLIAKGNFSSLLKAKNNLYVLKNNTEIFALDSKNKLQLKYTQAETKSIKKVQNYIYVISKNEGINILNDTTFIFQKRINKYNSNLDSNTINDVFEDAENNIFIATNTGLFIKQNRIVSEKPQLQIASISVNYKQIDTINTNNYNKLLTLETDQNNVSFLLQSISINNAKNIQFRYQLNNANFSPWSAENQINFANLSAGKYILKAQTRFKNGGKTSTKIFSFSIDQPIYKKTWFISLVFIMVCLAIAGFVELYIRGIKKKINKQVKALQIENKLISLEQKALQLQMNPHFIFNVLNGIKALGNSNDKKELNTSVNQFAILLRSVLNNSRLKEISLQEEIKTVDNYLNLEQKMSALSFDYVIEKKLNGIDAEEILIPPMLLQPFVENAIKHGISKINKKGKIKVSFLVKHSFLECFISDNGIGFYQSQKNKKNTKHISLALKITKERIENISKYSNFSIIEVVENKVVSGTEVWFKIPLKTDY